MTLELKKFDMKHISFKPNESKGPVVVLIGRRDTGKSFLVKDLLFYHQDIPIGSVVAGTEEGNGFYGKMVPKLFIHNEYNKAIIENILKRQKCVLKQIKKEVEAYKKSNIDPRTFSIATDKEKAIGYQYLKANNDTRTYVSNEKFQEQQKQDNSLW